MKIRIICTTDTNDINETELYKLQYRWMFIWITIHKGCSKPEINYRYRKLHGLIRKKEQDASNY